MKLLASIRANFWIAAILFADAVYLLALQGLIPYEEPYVYRLGEQAYITFKCCRTKSNQAIYGSFFGVHAIQVMVNPGLRMVQAGAFEEG